MVAVLYRFLWRRLAGIDCRLPGLRLVSRQLFVIYADVRFRQAYTLHISVTITAGSQPLKSATELVRHHQIQDVIPDIGEEHHSLKSEKASS